MKVITLITALCFCFSAEAVDISISVRFPSGNPIPNAVINYIGSDGSVGTTVTDLDGNVVLTGLTIMTTYQITARTHYLKQRKPFGSQQALIMK